MKKKLIFIFWFVILFLFLFVNYSNGFIKDDYLKKHVHIINSDDYFTLTSDKILTKLQDDLGCIDDGLYEELKFITYIKVVKVKDKNIRGKYSYDIQFGESGQKIKYKSLDTHYYIEELKENFGLDESVTDSDLKKGYKWNVNIIGKPTPIERGYCIYLKALYAGSDLNGIYNVETSKKEKKNVVADNADKMDKLVDWFKDFAAHPVGKIIQSVMDWFTDVIGDSMQYLANLVQRIPDNTYTGKDVMYSYKTLQVDGEYDGTGGDGLGNLDKYTKVGEYKKGEAVFKSIDIEKDKNENDEDDFTEENEIPVMIGDLYNIAVGHIDFIDVNFLTGNTTKNADGTGLRHEEDSIWTNFRNFAAAIIRMSIYLASAILVMTLIWYGIGIVRHTFDNPRARLDGKEGINRLKNSLLILIGTILFMSLCIFGSQSLYNSISKEDSYELPIRVNVEDTYSFSTTPTGYVRYMASTVDLEEGLQKLAFSMAYIVLAAINLLAIVFMILRMFVLWILSIIGPIISVFYAFGKQSPLSLQTWGGLYLSFSFIQVVITIVYIVILNVLI
jgi:hypothetical protein